MKFFVDENLPAWLAKGLDMLDKESEIFHLSDVFDCGTADTEWLRVVGKEGWLLLSRDRAIRRRPAEINSYRRNAVGGFVLGGKKMSGWSIVEQIVRNWRKIKEMASNTKRPFLFRIPPRGKKIVRIDLR
jgi:hypothetical protein